MLVLLQPIKKNQLVASKSVKLTPKPRFLATRIILNKRKLKEKTTKTLTNNTTQAEKRAANVKDLGNDLELKHDLSRTVNCSWDKKMQLSPKKSPQHDQDIVHVKNAWALAKDVKLPRIRRCDPVLSNQNPRLLGQGSNSVQMLINWSGYWNSNQSGIDPQDCRLTTEMLVLARRRRDARHSLSMLEISEHAQLIRNRIKMKSNNSFHF